MAPWAATGAIAPLDARLFAAALTSDPALEDDLTAARAEQAAVCAMGEALGRPSARPLHALFAAIDAGSAPKASNVTRMTPLRSSRFAFGTDASIGPAAKKFVRMR